MFASICETPYNHTELIADRKEELVLLDLSDVRDCLPMQWEPGIDVIQVVYAHEDDCALVQTDNQETV